LKAYCNVAARVNNPSRKLTHSEGSEVLHSQTAMLASIRWLYLHDKNRSLRQINSTLLIWTVLRLFQN